MAMYNVRLPLSQRPSLSSRSASRSGASLILSPLAGRTTDHQGLPGRRELRSVPLRQVVPLLFVHLRRPRIGLHPRRHGAVPRRQAHVKAPGAAAAIRRLPGTHQQRTFPYPSSCPG